MAEAALPPVIFSVTISFKQQQATVRLALPGEDYAGKPLEALLPQLELLSTQHICGAYKIKFHPVPAGCEAAEANSS